MLIQLIRSLRRLTSSLNSLADKAEPIDEAVKIGDALPDAASPKPLLIEADEPEDEPSPPRVRQVKKKAKRTTKKRSRKS